MSDLSKGSLVRHVSLGVGKVVAIEATAVHVFFPGSDRRHAAKLRWPMARPLLSTEVGDRDEWLEGLSSFSMDASTGRYALATNWLGHDQAVAEFRDRIPEGFAGLPGGRAAAWRAASAGWAERFGHGEGEALLAAGDVKRLVKLALEVERLVVRVPGVLGKRALQGAFALPEPTSEFFAALFDVVAAQLPGQARLDRLFAAAHALAGADRVAWPLATLFPFLAHPERHMLLQLNTTRAAVERLGGQIHFRAEPNAGTYGALLDFTSRLRKKLAPLGARDHVDVEVFLHSLASRRSKAGKRSAALATEAETA